MSVMTSVPPPNMQHPPPRMMMGGQRFPPPGGGHFNSEHHPNSSHQPRPRMAYQPYRLYPRPTHPQNADANVEYDGRRLRKSLVRKTVDYNAAIVRSLQVQY